MKKMIALLLALAALLGCTACGQKEEAPHDGPPPQAVGGEMLPPLPGHQGQEHRSGGKPDGQQEKHRHHIQGVFHDEKGSAPDEGGGKEHGLCQKSHGFGGHDLQLLIEMESSPVVP